MAGGQGGLVPKGTPNSDDIKNPSPLQAQIHRDEAANGQGIYYGKQSDGTEEIIGGPGAGSGIPFANDSNPAANIIQLAFPGIAALSDALTFEARILTDNTGDTNLQINATGLKQIIDQDEQPLTGGELEDESIYLFAYNQTLDKYQLLGLSRPRIGRFELSTGLESARQIGSNSVASGDHSTAMGLDTVASGNQAVSEGNTTTASGENSHSEGLGNVASGDQSHVEGNNNVASGDNSHAEGANNVASNINSHAEGNGGVASGISSHKEGEATTASGDHSHAEGQDTVASGINSHAEGNTTVATNDNAHSEGNGTVASGENSHAEGNSSVASGNGAHSEGNSNVASNENAHAEGADNVASGINSHAEGQEGVASGRASHSGGKQATATRVSEFARSDEGLNSPGDNLWCVNHYKIQTDDDTPTVLQNSESGQFNVKPDSAVNFKILVTGVSGAGDTFSAHIEGAIRNVGGTTEIVGIPDINVNRNTPGTNLWDVNILANDVNDTLEIEVTGANAEPVFWGAKVSTMEVLYPAS